MRARRSSRPPGGRERRHRASPLPLVPQPSSPRSAHLGDMMGCWPAITRGDRTPWLPLWEHVTAAAARCVLVAAGAALKTLLLAAWLLRMQRCCCSCCREQAAVEQAIVVRLELRLLDEYGSGELRQLQCGATSLPPCVCTPSFGKVQRYCPCSPPRPWGLSGIAHLPPSISGVIQPLCSPLSTRSKLSPDFWPVFSLS